MQCQKCGENKYLGFDVRKSMVKCRRMGCGETWKVSRDTGERIEPTAKTVAERLAELKVSKAILMQEVADLNKMIAKATLEMRGRPHYA